MRGFTATNCLKSATYYSERIQNNCEILCATVAYEKEKDAVRDGDPKTRPTRAQEKSRMHEIIDRIGYQTDRGRGGNNEGWAWQWLSITFILARDMFERCWCSEFRAISGR